MKNITILGGAFFCIAILFSSCDNFLKGSQTQKQLEQTIKYANADEYPIYVTYSGSSGVVKTPAGGQVNKKVTDVFTVSFEPFVDYEFICWKIIDETANKELQNGEYLLLESLTSSETQCTFVKKPEANMKLCLTPVLTERPQILSYAPVLTSSMSLRDSSIQVMFDHNMDEASIYYTQEELTKLMSTLCITDPNDAALKTITIDGQKKYYGYVQDGEIYFKNISIENNSTGENLTGCYTAPVFETPRLLSIKPNENQLPPDFQQILVSLGKNFFYTQEQKQITMSGSKKWIYQVNNERDEEGPQIITNNPKLKLYIGDKLEELPEIAWNTGVYAQPGILKFSKDNSHKLYLDIMLKDEGCGLSPTFDLVLLNCTTNQEITKTINYQKVSIWDASFAGQIDLGELDESLYAVSFNFTDRRGQKTRFPDDGKSIYFSRDVTPPDVKYYIKSARTKVDPGSDYVTNVYAKLVSGYSDLKEMIIECTANQEPIKLSYLQNNEWNSSLEGVGIFTVKYLEDFAGNRLEVNSPSIDISQFHLDTDNYIFVYGKGVVKDLCVSPYETTQGEFEKYFSYFNNTPSDTYGDGSNYPVYYVTLYQARQYCNKLSVVNGFEPCYYELQDDGTKQYDFTQWSNVYGGGSTAYSCNLSSNPKIKCDNTKNGYRLPTMEEWLYIANEANSTEYAYSGSNDLDSVAWYSGNSGYKSHEVGKKAANSLGIYDMTGNVSEFIEGGYIAGGDYTDNASFCGIGSYRNGSSAYLFTGFRMVRNAQAPAQ